jgi:hypothetical protein
MSFIRPAAALKDINRCVYKFDHYLEMMLCAHGAHK